MKHVLILALFAVILSPAAQAETKDSWRYEPIDIPTWQRAAKFASQKHWKKLLALGLQLEKRYPPSKLEGAEAQLITADAFDALGITNSAYQNWIAVARNHPNTSPANYALLKISDFHASHRYPDDQIFRLVNEGRQRVAPGEAQSMLAYYTALDSMKKGFVEWVGAEVKKIAPESYWHRRMKFMVALDSVRANKLTEARVSLEALSSDKTLEPQLKRDIDWQLARLYLDLGQYAEAEKIYGQFLFEGRDFGRALLERAWIRYFNKDYSTALGMLYSMRAPFFNSSRTPEQYLLAAMIYRDLCHYGPVKETAAEFDRVFADPLKKLRSERMAQIPELLSMELVKANVIPAADQIAEIREQVLRLKGSEFAFANAYLNKYVKALSQQEGDVRRRVEYQSSAGLKQSANALLESKDQMKLLEYVSGLEQLKAEKNVKREYAAVKEEPMKFEKFYWPFKKEYWWDETSKLKVLIKDQCEGSAK